MAPSNARPLRHPVNLAFGLRFRVVLE